MGHSNGVVWGTGSNDTKTRYRATPGSQGICRAFAAAREAALEVGLANLTTTYVTATRGRATSPSPTNFTNRWTRHQIGWWSQWDPAPCFTGCGKVSRCYGSLVSSTGRPGSWPSSQRDAPP
jgi:hypothetical protein